MISCSLCCIVVGRVVQSRVLIEQALYSKFNWYPWCVLVMIFSG